jgi:hypothetical protein
MSDSHFNLVACSVRESILVTTGASTLESRDRSSSGLDTAASEGSGEEIGMVKSNVAGEDKEDEGCAVLRVSTDNAAEDNSSCDGKLVTTVIHTSPSPSMVIAPVMIPLEDCC